MYLKKKSFKAALSVEVAISIVLVTIALFVTLGLFSDNLQEMIAQGSFQKIFSAKDKTTYSMFNRNYSNASIDVQMTGEQGLEQLRKRANNIAFEIANNYIKGSDTSIKAINTLEYLTIVIYALVGEPHICTNMKKETLDKCDASTIGGYQYSVALPTGDIIKTRPYSPTSPLQPIQKVSLANASSAITKFASRAESAPDKYAFIVELTEAAKPYIYSSAILVSKNEKFNGQDKSVDDAIIDLARELKESVKNAYQICSGNQTYCCSKTTTVGQCYVGSSENNNFGISIERLITAINDSKNDTEYDYNNVNTFLNFINGSYNGNTTSSNTILEIINNDHVNDPTSCQILTDGLENIRDTYGVSVNIPYCVPSTRNDVGGSVDVGNTVSDTICTVGQWLGFSDECGNNYDDDYEDKKPKPKINESL